MQYAFSIYRNYPAVPGPGPWIRAAGAEEPMAELDSLGNTRLFWRMQCVDDRCMVFGGRMRAKLKEERIQPQPP